MLSTYRKERCKFTDAVSGRILSDNNDKPIDRVKYALV